MTYSSLHACDLGHATPNIDISLSRIESHSAHSYSSHLGREQTPCVGKVREEEGNDDSKCNRDYTLNDCMVVSTLAYSHRFCYTDCTTTAMHDSLERYRVR